MNLLNGIVVYRHHHDNGAILLYCQDINDVKLFELCKSNKCIWEQHGICLLINNEIIYSCYSDNYYEDCCGGWTSEYYKNNLYKKKEDKLVNITNVRDFHKITT